MKSPQRALRLAVQVSLLIALAATSAVLLLQTYLGDPEKVYKDGSVTEVVQQGPVTIDRVQWKLESLEAYTQLVDAEKKKISLDQPAGSVVIVAEVAITPLDGLAMGASGFTCVAKLRDDRGNIWESQSAYDFALPTSCGDDDHPFTRNKTGRLAQVYVVPESAVAHLSGIQVETRNDFRRVLMTR
ncbi:hypothetical protein [Streptomyces sp. SID13031]|uniref:hypothetical protein n=1 Tax=Streptomyces sp. SID13031 TaxID=2706046 RepID=UPI0013CABD9F|nr:hypothetical protein [Streptomyces sp. SID13031]NEA33339.1 hypothetical protein [Streptomyces sp. SID13031]